jgi:hypothetical protein
MRQIISRHDLDQKVNEAGRKVPGKLTTSPDSYLNRLVKYVPTEVIALYLTLGSLSKSDPDATLAIQSIAFAVCLIGTPLYLWRVNRVRKVLQLSLSTASFVLWALTIGGALTEHLLGPYGLDRPAFLATLPVLGTFIIALIEP